MKSKMETGKQKFYQTVVNITFTLDMKLSVDGDTDEWDAEHRAEEIINDLIANGEMVIVNSETASVYGNITDVNVEAVGEITSKEFDCAPGKPDLHLGSSFKLK